MLTQIEGLHHVTAMARDASANNAFFTGSLGLRRVKKTVNFDAPDVYHLYYGNEIGAPGTVMTYFPFPNMARGRPGAGEVGTTVFAVPEGALPFWCDRLAALGVPGLAETTRFGETRLSFEGPDGDGLALVERPGDVRTPWTGGGVDAEAAIRGLHSVSLRLGEVGATAELLRFMGYAEAGREGSVTRFLRADGNGADVIDLEEHKVADRAREGAGSVHHVAFAVKDRAAQDEVREALTDTGYALTSAMDRGYFWAIYFRTPGGVLFEVATDEPGFARDEDADHLGEALKLPEQHEHLRPWLQTHLQPLAA
jgi:glyoxalase family protein